MKNSTKHIPFNHFVEKLERALEFSLPGEVARKKLMSASRRLKPVNCNIKQSPKKSAILILFYSIEEKIHLVLIKRACDSGIHSNQIAFPGGKYEDKDKSLKQTALREAFEEIGVDPRQVQLMGKLTKLFIPASNFDVYPFVGYSLQHPDFKVNESEVAVLLEVPLDDLLNPAAFCYKTIRYRKETEVEVPCYFVQNEIVWGATAFIISELLEVIYKIV